MKIDLLLKDQAVKVDRSSFIYCNSAVGELQVLALACHKSDIPFVPESKAQHGRTY